MLQAELMDRSDMLARSLAEKSAEDVGDTAYPSMSVLEWGFSC